MSHPDEPVRMAWRDRDETARAEGRAEDGHAILPRRDAETLLNWLLRCPDDRFDYSIDPWPPPVAAAASPTPEAPVGWIAVLGFLRSAWGFLRDHRRAAFDLAAAVALLLLAALAIGLPTAHLRAVPVVLLAAAAAIGGFILAHEKP